MKRENWNSRLRLALALLLQGSLVTPAVAQTVSSETTWGGPSSDFSEGVAVASDGSSYLVGGTRSFSEFDNPIIFVLKFGTDGSLTWQRSWDGPDPFLEDSGQDVAVAPDGSIYVGGTTLGTGGGDGLLLHVGADGTLLSQRTWGSPDGDFGHAVDVASDGSVYFVGGTRLSDPSALDVFVVKLAGDGSLVWQKTWGTAGSSEEASGVAVAPDGSVYVSTVTANPDVAFTHSLTLLKIDPAGNLVWARTFAFGEGTDARGGVAVAPDGSVYVAGGVFDPRTFDLNALLVKFAADGTFLWDRSWGGSRTGDDASGVAVASDGTVILGGQTGLGAGGDDAFVVRFQPGGRLIDAVTWGSTALDRGADVAVATGGVVSLGATVSAPPPYSLLDAPAKASRLRKATIGTVDVPLVDAAGTLAEATGVFGTPAGSTTYAGSFDAALVRIAYPATTPALIVEPVGVDEVETMRAESEPQVQATGMRVGPNPASSSVAITLSLPREARGSEFFAAVFDLAGRRVRDLASGSARDEGIDLQWDLRSDAGVRVANGLYFVTVVSGGFRATERVVVAR